ncbi:ABC transporter substrate-binding protein [Paracoccus sp. SCSIO 75233]|uniref:ABC transporter substrate-binding protein n=1 Tax=Paracoccus sp. SCSIO 75233 TaxID=3017782 RepID=UPI0022F0299C|nr:TAXI family TRAP transporter solute-binding subunit [Paracoccus sp. SCSIO 75233]WBU53990.1 ABC transporter substrate-binding protein [Paracoccus sp. SCSIO 75233]
MTSRQSLNRRALLRGAVVSASAVALPGLLRAQDRLDQLALFGPPAGPSVTLAHAVATDRFADIATAATMTAWRTPDELRAGLTSGQIVASVVPAQLAANLYNRGFPIRLANIMTEGLLYVLSEDREIGAIPDLAGRSVAVPFRGDTPEILFTQLLRHHGLGEEDLTVSYAGTPVEAVQLLLAGRVEAAMVVEPAASAAVIQGRQAGKDVTRVIDITAEWGAMTGGPAVLPMAGLALTEAIYAEASGLVEPIRAAIRETLPEVLADPEAAAANATGVLGLPVPVIAESVPNSRLVARNASEVRSEIEAMFRAMAGDDLGRIGGKMPGEEFYL